MAVKRRTVWFDDDEWAALKQEAHDRHQSVSGVLRIHWQLAAAEHKVATTTGLRILSQAERDSILQKIVKA